MENVCIGFIIVCAGVLYWIPSFLVNLKKNKLKFHLISLLLILIGGLGLIIGGLASFARTMGLTVYIAILYGFSVILARGGSYVKQTMPGECLHAAIGLFAFGGVILCDIPENGMLKQIILLSNIPVTLASVSGINIFRSVFYEVSPWSDYFFTIPSWWESALFFVVLSLILLGIRLFFEYNPLSLPCNKNMTGQNN